MIISNPHNHQGLAPPFAAYLVGSEYRRLAESEAPLDRTKQYRKIHDWVAFIDIIEGTADVIDYVSFSFLGHVFACHSPTMVGGKWRFQSRQQTYGVVSIQIQITGIGGTTIMETFQVKEHNSSFGPRHFYESKQTQKGKPWTPARLPRGDELICSVAIEFGHNQQQAGQNTTPTRCFDDTTVRWLKARNGSDRMQIYSPWLSAVETIETYCPAAKHGMADLTQQHPTPVVELTEIRFKLPKSYDLQCLTKVCQNIVKYEEILWLFFGDSSNATAREPNNPTSTKQIKELASCRTFEDVRHCFCQDPYDDTMTDKSHFLKSFVLDQSIDSSFLISIRVGIPQQLDHTGRLVEEPGEFIVRFWSLFVYNSGRFRPVGPFRATRTRTFKLNMLFQHVIKDRSLLARVKRMHSDELSLCCSTLCTFSCASMQDEGSAVMPFLEPLDGFDFSCRMRSTSITHETDGFCRSISGIAGSDNGNLAETQQSCPPSFIEVVEDTNMAIEDREGLQNDVICSRPTHITSNVPVPDKHAAAAAILSKTSLRVVKNEDLLDALELVEDKNKHTWLKYSALGKLSGAAHGTSIKNEAKKRVQELLKLFHLRSHLRGYLDIVIEPSLIPSSQACPCRKSFALTIRKGGFVLDHVTKKDECIDSNYLASIVTILRGSLTPTDLSSSDLVNEVDHFIDSIGDPSFVMVARL